MEIEHAAQQIAAGSVGWRFQFRYRGGRHQARLPELWTLGKDTVKSGAQIRILGFLALSSVAVGALGSLAFTYIVGRHNNSIVLIALFTVWVSSPFVANTWMCMAFHRAPAMAQTMIHLTVLAISLGSLAIYGDVALGNPKVKPALPFLIVPLVSWIVVALVAATQLSKRRTDESA